MKNNLKNCCSAFRGSDQRTNQILAHRADVNTVCFVDDNTNVLASGADDGIVKVTPVPVSPCVISHLSPHCLRCGTAGLSASLILNPLASSVGTLTAWSTSRARETEGRMATWTWTRSLTENCDAGTWPATARTRASSCGTSGGSVTPTTFWRGCRW